MKRGHQQHAPMKGVTTRLALDTDTVLSLSPENPLEEEIHMP
jgi:hypothetical protein